MGSGALYRAESANNKEHLPGSVRGISGGDGEFAKAGAREQPLYCHRAVGVRVKNPDLEIQRPAGRDHRKAAARASVTGDSSLPVRIIDLGVVRKSVRDHGIAEHLAPVCRKLRASRQVVRLQNAGVSPRPMLP